jgi:hypothetical protein
VMAFSRGFPLDTKFPELSSRQQVKDAQRRAALGA